MARWKIQDAKARFSELVEKAQIEGPQMIIQHGHERAVLLSIEDYQALLCHQADGQAVLLGGPKMDDFSVPRDSDTGRKTAL
ncbi:type II toxin-antitoxin system Phd/YefM family antitoxin [Inquilinus sp.]|jgi:antitoxin Phd|uniref:type II toxin-antitoxin system Phd/YefM family antitoxin n=1 Tax=Inquilinus sp. TaxID=1932117 RepID=UPI003783F082